MSPVELVEEYLPNVAKMANQLVEGVPRYNQFVVEDLVQEGVLGLMHAAKAYRPKKHKNFWLYAQYRVRGAMNDYLRSLLPLGRRSWKLLHRWREYQEQNPGADDVKEKLGLSNYQEHLLGAAWTALVYTSMTPIYRFDMDAWIDQQDQERKLERVMRQLSTAQKAILFLRYHLGYKQAEIAKVCGCKTSQLDRLERTALSRMRKVVACA